MAMVKTWFIKSKMRRIKNTDIFFYGFILIYLILISYVSYIIPLWEDEFYSLNTSDHDLVSVIKQSYAFEAQPPIYFILLKIWRLICESIFFSRLLSIVFILSSAFFFSKIVTFLNNNKANRWVVTLFLLNPFTIWAALEIRTYALLILLSTITILLFIKYYNNNNKRHLYYFALISAIGLYTQYLFVFLIISLSLTLWILKGWKAFLRLCLCFIPVIIIFVPNFLFLFGNIKNQTTDNHINVGIHLVYKILTTPPKLLLGLNRMPTDEIPKLIVILISLILASYAYILSHRDHKATGNNLFNNINFLLYIILIFVVLYAVVFSITSIVYADQYMSIIFPVFMLLFALFNYYPGFYRKLFYVSVILFYLSLLLATYTHPIKNHDFIAITRYVQKIEQIGEPILFYRNSLSLPFKFYYKGQNTLKPLPGEVTYDTNYLMNISDTNELDTIFHDLETETGSYILLTDDFNSYLYSINMNRDIIDEYLDNHFKISLDTIFRGNDDRYLRIRRLYKQPL